jgi:hypothetical protein
LSIALFQEQGNDSFFITGKNFWRRNGTGGVSGSRRVESEAGSKTKPGYAASTNPALALEKCEAALFEDLGKKIIFI